MRSISLIDIIRHGSNLPISMFVVCSCSKKHFLCIWPFLACTVEIWFKTYNYLWIDVFKIIVGDINAGNIIAKNIDAYNINALNIKAGDIDAVNIKVNNIDCGNIEAINIKALDINYFAVCFAYYNIKCRSIKGKRNNAKHFVLDGKLEIANDQTI